MKPRLNVLRIGIAAVILSLLGAGAYVAAQPAEQVIKVSARKFSYTPEVIMLKKGVPAVLEFITEDVVMGFNAPDLGTRADIIPGKVTRVRVVADKTGNFVFHCDIFCGSGHEDMTGTITVVD